MKSLQTTFVIFSFLFFFYSLDVLVLSSRTISSDPCDPTAQQDPRTLRSDQLTVLINGYSESRIPLLQSIVTTYAASSLVSSILVLWGNPSTPSQTLVQLAHNLTHSSFGFNSISLIRHSSNSLNNRFLPRPSIKTRAVLVCDDDVEVDSKSFEFAFKMWGSNPDRLIGFFVRSHDIDLSKKEWIYTMHPDKYSIMLTKFMILKSKYLFQYSCARGPVMANMRKIVDKMHNCEDILMNFVVADEVNAGPILVGAKRARDWGDARNDHDHMDGQGRRGLIGEVAQVGLSSRKEKHRKRRGECIGEFHRVLGRMPLRYSYGKVVNSVGEQGLCQKGGKLVLCDQS
ncbi:putative glucuronosyl-galactosyl-proteoglycan 4-alpha-N-acetylglucosaminyltransferase [Rosa chinensis]|uniref:Putative glucuronosyl-galactosyl-proteoglycan 4-alpha-N-acetylglucosaminyltransferase n=1 Tax=Rosa chinensis TaxID=74649 RepID=A0A2P6PZU2_ROSCH|nr:glycosyltransferase family protein 64 C3 [Rosa chinensis]PRQ27454.1 putative glucuronosyl-galactosyl-proteoglycan 4-alpha-N-acetylglucosaminyltransferase [Rosa chinensis]